MVAFEDHFWGEKHAGYDVLYQNMKQEQLAAKEFADFMRDRVSSEESYGKLLHRLAKSSSSVTSLGSFHPWWEILRTSTEKVANIHFQVMQKLVEVIKEVKEYGDALKEKHKNAKEDFSSTSDIVQAMQVSSAALLKAKENYQSRCAELERAKKENSKDLEKAEQKAKKATEEYKTLVEKREEVRSHFVIRMKQTCKKFQQLESEHLKSMKNHIGKYLNSLESGHLLIGQVFNDFKTQLSNLPVEKLIQSFVNEKETGKETPNVITFELFEGGTLPSPTEQTIETTNNIPRTHSSSAFLKKKRKDKEKKKKKKLEKSMTNGSIGSPSSESGDVAGEGTGEVLSPTVDEEGYTIRPPDAESISNKSRSSFSDSDSEEEEPVKIHVKINPVENGSGTQAASIDELKALTRGLTLQSPASIRKDTNGEGLSRGRTSSSGNLQKNQLKGFSSSSDLVDICFTGDSFSSKTAPDSASISSRSSSTPPEESKSPLEDLSFLDPIKTATITTGSKDEIRSSGSNSSLFDIAEVPPELPAKKSHSSPSHADDTATEPCPPPLPVKRGVSVMANKPSNPGSQSPKQTVAFHVGSLREETPGTSSCEDLSSVAKVQNTEAGKFPAPIRPPPIGGEIARANSVGGIVALPRPKAGSLQQAKTGSGLVPPPVRNNTLPPRAANTLLALSAFSGTKEETKPALAPLATEDPFGIASGSPFKADFSSGFASFDDNFNSGSDSEFKEGENKTITAKPLIPSTNSGSDLRAIFEEALRESEALNSPGGTSANTLSPDSENTNTSPLMATSTSSATTSSLDDTTLSRTSSVSALGIGPPIKAAVSTLPRANTTGSIIPNKSMTLPHSSSKKDSIPIAVAFIECVNAVFKGSDLSKCVAKITGDMTISFPASIIPILATSPSPPLLTFQMTGISTIEQIVPNKALLVGEGSAVDGDAMEYSFNMNALASHLRKQAEQGNASYYNIDILKYQVKISGSSFQSIPLQLCSFWKCEKLTTDLRVDFKYNGTCLSSLTLLSNVSVIAPVDGGVTVMRSKPPATWSSETQRATWKIPEISSTEPQGPGYLRARFDVPEGPSTPAPLSVQFSCDGATISRVNFELNNKQYRVSLVKKKFSTGKYIIEPSPTPTSSSNC